MGDFNISEDWKNALNKEFTETYFEKLMAFVSQERNNYTVFPPPNLTFNAYNLISINDIKVVILGQDPYHGQAQAHGLSFSVSHGVPHPPSLRNIFKELNSDLNHPIPAKTNGDLTHWAKQGVLLLNAVLTVREKEPNSHKGKGWEQFTDATIRYLSKNHTGIVFILWGQYAQAKESLIDEAKHLVLKSPHPSPFSARKGFFGSKPFSSVNDYLVKQDKTPIDWRIE